LKIHQNTAKNGLKTHFFHFSDAYNFMRKHRGKLGDPSICLEFLAFSDGCVLKFFSRTLLVHGVGVSWFLVNVSAKIFF
jgi:hypothetical protein